MSTNDNFVHPLASLPIEHMRGTEAWLKQWYVALRRKPLYIEELIGLLHVGFDIHPTHPAHTAYQTLGRERFKIYLSLAQDFWTDGVGHEWCVRRVAEKALKELCSDVFLHRPSDSGRPDWWYLLHGSRDLLVLLLRLFDKGFRDIYPEKKKDNEAHHMGILRDFFRQFLDMVWTTNNFKTETPDLAVWLRQETLPLLQRLGELDRLLPGRGAIIEPVTLDWLRVEAMQIRVSHRASFSTVAPGSVEEAHRWGSKEAKVYLMIAAWQAEEKRLFEVARLEAEKAAAALQAEKAKEALLKLGATA